MANLFQKLLGIGGQVTKRGSTAAKTTKELLEEGPEVIGKGTSKLAKESAEEIPDAAWREITQAPKPISSFDAIKQLAKENPKAAAALTTLIGGTAVNQFLGNSDEEAVQVPFSKGQEPKSPILPEDYMKLAQDEANSMDDKKTASVQAAKEDGLDFDALAKKFDENMAKLPKDQPTQPKPEPEIDEFQLASDRAERNALLAGLGKAANMIGSGIATVGAGRKIDVDSSGFDDLLKMADKPIARLKEKKAHEKLTADMLDEKSMRDPDSEVSRTVSELAIKTGLIKPGQKVSAMTLKNAGVNLGTLLSTIEAGNARRDAAALARESRASEREERANLKREEEDKKRLDKRKLITEEVEDRSRNITDSINLLQDKIGEVGTFELTGPEEENMKRLVDTIATDMAKLSDPGSVARPGEVELWRKNLAKVGGLQGLGMTNQTAKDILESFKGEVEKRRQHAYKVRGVTPDNEPTPQADNNSGEMVRVIPPATKENPNPKAKLIPRDQVEAAIRAGGKIAQ